MGAGYSNSAFDYNKDDIGIDPDTKMKFVPNQKEFELFKKEKMNLYKGTWTVCFVYGVSALILLITILFTETGRTHIYDKYLPAVITYVVGAIIIILYLIYSIFNIKPRKLGKVERVVYSCPDYWKYDKEDDVKKKENILKNITTFSTSNLFDPYCTISNSVCAKPGSTNKQYILNSVDDIILNNNTSNKYINYKCKPDMHIYGEITNNLQSLNAYNTNTLYNQTGQIIYTNLDGDEKNMKLLNKYAQVSGVYKSEFLETSNMFRDDNNSNYFTYNEVSKTPLICNELYPALLSGLEKTPDDTKVRCAYAKKCGVSWSDIDCYENIV
jgi:hypothetical protein